MRTFLWRVAALLGAAQCAHGQAWFGPVTNTNNGSTYYVLRTAMTYPNSLAAAQAQLGFGAGPATIRNAGENDWIVSNLVTPTGNQTWYWINGQRINNTPNSYQFVKVIGAIGAGDAGTTRADPARYTSWMSGEPSDTNNAEDFVVLRGSAGGTLGQWNDVDINAGISVYPMIVEVPRDCNGDGVPDLAQGAPLDTGVATFRRREDWIYLQTPNLIRYDLGDATIECWFRTTTNGPILSDNDQPVPLPYSPNTNWTVPYAYVGVDGKLRMCVWWSSSTIPTSPVPVNDGLWHHGALVLHYTSATIPGPATATMYLDGVPVAQQSVVVPAPTLNARRTYVGLWQSTNGWPSSWGNIWAGGNVDVAELRIWREARTQAQLVANKHVNLVGQVPVTLNAYYRMYPEAAGAGVKLMPDSSGHINLGVVGGYGGAGANFPTFLPGVMDLNDNGVPDTCEAFGITTQPESTDVCASSTYTLSVRATGAGAPLGYQWYKNDAPIAGAIARTLTIPSFRVGDAGAYRVLVSNMSNAAQSVLSDTAFLAYSTAIGTPVLTPPPGTVSACLGMPFTMSVAAPGPNLRFQWLRSGVPIPGATSANYTIPSVTPSDSGAYACRISNACGTLMTDQVFVGVLADGPQVTGNPYTSACSGSVCATPMTVLPPRPGEVVTVGSSGGDGPLHNCRTSDGFVTWTATNQCGYTTTFISHVYVGNVTFLEHPRPTTACLGGTAQFSVTLPPDNDPPGFVPWIAEYHWSNNAGIHILTLGPTLTLTDIQPYHAGSWSCFVIKQTPPGVSPGGYCTSTSHSATLTISPSACCPADVDDGSGTGTRDGGVTIDDLLFYVTVFEAGDIRADLDDGSGTGTRDGGVTIDDLLYFVTHFEIGC